MALTDALVLAIVALASAAGTTLAAVLAFRTAWSAQRQLAELQRKVWIGDLTKNTGRSQDAIGLAMATKEDPEVPVFTKPSRQLFHQEDLLVGQL